MLSALMLIPNWIFMLVFMYFFWITVPNVYSQYLAQEDYSFNIMLPVSKREVALSKVASLIIMELLHIVLAVVFAVLHNAIYGVWNPFIDLTPAFFGFGFFMYGLFNIIFLPKYFKTAYFYGKPTILGVVVTLVFGLGLETIAIGFPKYAYLVEPSGLGLQLVYLIVGIVFFVVFNIIAAKQSVKNYESIK
jgi:hypothetical protein